MLHLIWMFIVGIVVGLIARWIMPGAQGMGLFMTGILGIVGAVVGGYIARLFSKPPEGSPVHPVGIIMSVIGALVVLWVVQMLQH
ncbi:putative membrane protein YeaQ/YmgE (transglycosylase-associated protein family) [Silvimonas terrae]|uniref:Putative membrane protein YeaQ/YmgE (Transglycosylase-associated protein family) n=1 Tax=Silvimonas terrae TaxID=300266 RepID=A0A840RMR6_9NEIS|nr:GlsB/YeaQ/YmgE family stress response membrane protein [Silvimonas terrae]MBB5193566.1 putative membrane protein YeaQ/YmgE (transglycosylase-associated protein family) [Silvimonas terrae]